MKMKKKTVNKKPIKPARKEKVIIVDSVNIGYNPKQFSRKSTQTNNELNLYIPEKWQR